MAREDPNDRNHDAAGKAAPSRSADPARSDRVRHLYETALTLSQDEQSPFLERETADDPSVRLEVESRLRERNSVDVSSDIRAMEAETIPPRDAPPMMPRQVGQYRLKGIIGSGGMGSVFEAVQEHPRRTVAVKLMRQGVTSRSAARRFEYESQLLARLRHPGIAQVYEAGLHDDGTGGVPFFAMEFIAGAKSLTNYAESKQLTTREKLLLFMDICDAIHHGHQKGIIHRDLKPENILVDSGGQVKIIDFGVARATDSDLAVTTLQTDVGQLVGTVQYMSPEQIEADPHDIDIRSDVYSLGVVLYKLLTGKLPYDVSGTPVYEATRVIRETQPKRISTIDKTLRGDIETIVLHALEKNRDRRYQSAHEFAQDIDRYLDNRTIAARPPSIAYQFRTFVRRNKYAVGGLAAVILILTAATIMTSWQMVDAMRANRIAEREKTTATQIMAYLQGMFRSLDPREGVGYDARVASLLDDAVSDLDTQDMGVPEAEAAVRWSIGEGYRALELWEQAETQFRAALRLQRGAYAGPNEETAKTLESLSAVLWFQKRYDAMEKAARESLIMRETVHGDDSVEVASSLNYLAPALEMLARLDEAEAAYRRALDIRKRHLGERDELVGRSLNNLAYFLMEQDRPREAEPLLRDAIAIVRSRRGEHHIDIGSGLTTLGRCLLEMGRYEDAAESLRGALDVRLAAVAEKRLPENDLSIANTRMHLARALMRIGQLAEAEVQASAALTQLESQRGPQHKDTIACRQLLAEIRAGEG